MISSVVDMLSKTQVPVEVTVPLDGQRPGAGSIAVKYSDKYIGPVLEEVIRMVKSKPELFTENSLFLADPFHYPGQDLSSVTHFRMDSETGKHPLQILKGLMIDARKEAQEKRPDGNAKWQEFQSALERKLKEIGWI